MVYQGLNMTNGQLIAVKTVKLSGDQKMVMKEVEALKHEIILLRELQHTNIVKYLYSDTCPDKTGIDIILEFVPGGSIRNLLNKFSKFDE
jgi:mitogen-activated protein kinase kinase kinase